MRSESHVHIKDAVDLEFTLQFKCSLSFEMFPSKSDGISIAKMTRRYEKRWVSENKI